MLLAEAALGNYRGLLEKLLLIHALDGMATEVIAVTPEGDHYHVVVSLAGLPGLAFSEGGSFSAAARRRSFRAVRTAS